jgi:hypothetical protein
MRWSRINTFHLCPLLEPIPGVTRPTATLSDQPPAARAALLRYLSDFALQLPAIRAAIEVRAGSPDCFQRL